MNTRQQGDVGEASAIEWLTSKGALVLVPLGHSPEFDLVAQVEGRLLRIQVKSSTQERRADDDQTRNVVSVGTSGGNQSWNGETKKLDPSAFDFLFVLPARGRRWFIPSGAVDAGSALQLGGSKYAEYEIEAAASLRDVVFEPLVESARKPGGVPKRSNGRGCKPRGLVPSQVRILSPPLPLSSPVEN